MKNRSWVHWQEIEDGTWVLYEGERELFRAPNEDCMTCLVDFSRSEYYHHLIEMNTGVGVYSIDGDLLERQTAPYNQAWKIKETR